MRLSEAIRKGCKSTKKIKHHYVQRDYSGNPIGACAIGAARVGAGNSYSKFSLLHEEAGDFPTNLIPKDVRDIVNPCVNISFMITSLNDTHDWSREAIAMWIETLEDYLKENREVKEEAYQEEKCQPVLI